MKRWIHANTANSNVITDAIKAIGEYLVNKDFGFSDYKTFAARITEEGDIEYVTTKELNSVFNEDPEYFRQSDPYYLFLDYYELLTDNKSKVAFAKKHGFLDEYASY